MRLLLAFLSLLLLAVPAAQAGQASSTGAAPPVLNVHLSPQTKDGAIDRVDVELKFSELELDAGEPLLRMPLVIAGMPTAAYDASAIQARDGRGALTLTAVEEEPTPSGRYRSYTADRPIEGAIEFRYTAPLRQVTSSTRHGPLFDLRAQPGGAVGAGLSIFALPPTEETYRIKLDWDLSGLPQGSRGVWSFGEGASEHDGTMTTLSFTYFAFGDVKSEPESGSGPFGLYWFGQPTFDAPAVAALIQPLYAYMADFFKDEPDATYRVFIRHNIHPGGGGTALQRSFVFGYDDSGDVKTEDLQFLLAHEMVHNWPSLSGGEHGQTAWYTEGNADFYSLRLLHRAGLLNVDQFLAAMNSKARQYYTNPHLNLTNQRAGELFWQDSDAQRVPYGRGLMYLVEVDAMVRQASGGQRSLDDLVVEVLERQRSGEQIGLEAWMAIVQRELGEAGPARFRAMAAGETLAPPANSLAPCLRPVARSYRAFDLGFDDRRLGQVSELREGSAAAAAGLRNGDVVISSTDIHALRDSEDLPMEMVIERDAQRHQIRYLPRTAAVQGWGWERVPGVADAACNL